MKEDEQASMNPLSPLTYYMRHKRNALLLLSLITLTTLGLYVMISVLDSVTLMNAETSYLRHVSQIIPNGDPSFEPGVISQIRNNPDVERVIPENGTAIRYPSLLGSSYVSLLGIPQDDLEYLLDSMHLRIKDGRLLARRTNEIMLSEGVVRSLGLQLGDQLSEAIDPESYDLLPAQMVLVGILESDPEFETFPATSVGFASYEYLDSFEDYQPLLTSMLVVAKDGRRQDVSAYLESEIQSPRTEVDTYEREYRFYSQDRQGLLRAFGIINCIVAIGAAMIVGIVNQIAITQRLSELGLLNAFGFLKKHLIRRLALETATVTSLSWAIGLVLAFAILIWMKTGVYYDKGMELDLLNLTPLWFVIPIPLTIIILSTIGIARVFSRFDAVSIVERGKLSLVTENNLRISRTPSRFGVLSVFNFYLRHRRRGVTLLVSIVLSILVVSLPIFIGTATTEAMKPDLEYLHYVSEVFSEEDRFLDTGMVAQIKSQPMVERVVPVMSLTLEIAIPMGNRVATDVYGVPEDDLPYLLDLFGMKVVDGRLPTVRSNEIVIAEPVALNLGLGVGDTIKLPHYILYGAELTIFSNEPVEMEIVGILERCERPQRRNLSSKEMWLGFASYEFMSSHESLSSQRVRLFVVPTDERKAELDHWLVQTISSKQTNVSTYDSRYTEISEKLKNLTISFTAVEIGIAVVASLTITILTYILFTQRREEFGILTALGRSQLWLVLRTIKETGSIVTLAWLISVAIFGVSIAIVQIAVFTPKGIHLNLLNPIPWLFTFPIPFAIVISSAGTIAGLLTKLDPISIIERR